MWQELELIDISMSIEEKMPVYKGNKDLKPEFKLMRDHQSGDVYQTRVAIDMHTGTHIDAPLHMIKNGKGIESFGMQNIFSDCQVLDLTTVTDKISARDLMKHNIEQGQYVLFKTRNSFEERIKNFIYLAEDGAEYLLEKGIKGVGIDTPGIERDQTGHPTHKKLLGNGIFIVEGLMLNEIAAGKYMLLVVPIKIKGVEAAPARAFLIKKDNLNIK